MALERPVALLEKTRTVSVGSGKREPLGVDVTFRVVLNGLRSKDVSIRWSIFEATRRRHRLLASGSPQTSPTS
jgi:hypothetical protein